MTHCGRKRDGEGGAVWSTASDTDMYLAKAKSGSCVLDAEFVRRSDVPTEAAT